MTGYQRLLNSIKIDDGYYIANIDFDQSNNEYTIDVDCESQKACCPTCAQPNKIHDRLEKKWRHTNFDGAKVYIRFKTPRVKCNDHGVKLTQVNWAKPKHRFTIELEDLVCKQAKDKSFLQIARELDEHDTRIRRVVKRREDEQKV